MLCANAQAQKLSALSTFTTLADGDKIEALDVSDTSGGVSGTNLAITWGNVKVSLGAQFTGGTSIVTVGTIGTGTWDGTDVAVTAGGTGRSTSTTAYGLIAAGTTATGAQQTLAAGATTELLVGGGASALPVWTTATGTGAPVRAGTPTLTTPVIGAATGTSVTLTGVVHGWSGTAIPAGGTAGSGLRLSSTSNFGVFFGSGAPSLSAAQGSIYLRSDGAPYYNNNGTTGWTAIAASVDQGANYTWTGTHDYTGATVTFGTMDVTTLTATSFELSHASANTLTASAGVLSVEGVAVAMRTGGNTFSGAQALAESATVDLDPAPSADGVETGIAVTGTAGATLAYGDLIVLDVTDSRWELADANAASGADGDCRGMIGICILAAAADGSPTKILLQGIVRADTAFPTFTVNAPVYVSETAGDVIATSPTTEDNVVRFLGTAFTADSIYFNPAPTWVIYDAP